MGVRRLWEEKWRKDDLVEEEESDLLVTNSDLGRALWAALASYRLLSLRLAHDGEQGLQKNIQQALHHHLHLLLNWSLLQRHRNKETNPVKEAWLQPELGCYLVVLIFSMNWKDLFMPQCFGVVKAEKW